jgi:nitrite reductase/ring-hydroxylating ferredoxin subunit
VADNPVVIVRGKDGVLRAFFNVCRHRGGPLAVEDGCAKALQCKYHGWTYWLDGTLRGVPAFDRTELFDKKDFGLIPLRVAEWEGLAFVNLDANAPSLETFVAGIAERLRPIDLTPLRFFQRVDYEVACNWKVYVDNFMEAYHVPHVHPELCSLYDFQNYRTEAHGHYTVQYSPIATKDTGYGAGGDGIAWYFCLFPAFMLNILPGRLQTNLVIPQGAGPLHGALRVLLRGRGVAGRSCAGRSRRALQRHGAGRGHRDLRAGAARPGEPRLRPGTLLGGLRGRRLHVPGDAEGRLPARAQRLAEAGRSTTVARTGTPSVSRSSPPTTTCSPGASPLATSTNPGIRTPVSTGRRTALPSATT